MENQESGIKKIKEFTDLECWKQAHQLVLLVYNISQSFPKTEIFGITSQMRRAAISISSNIAEGFGRFSFKEKVQFYYLAHGSLTELKNQILIVKDIHYVSEKEYLSLENQLAQTHRLLRGLIQKTKQFINK